MATKSSSYRSASEACLLLLAMLALGALPAFGYPAYSQNSDENTGFCADCHGSFDKEVYVSLQDGTNWNETLMGRHQQFVNNSCTACHQPTPGATPVILDSSANFGLNQGCVGCHGRNEDAGTDTGQPVQHPVSLAGAGMRQRHFISGVMVCANCHGDANPEHFTPVGEEVLPPNYDSVLLDPNFNNDPCADDQVGPTGLDNDGDGLIDGDDPDCGGVLPTTGKVAQLLVTAHNPGSQTMRISYTPACNATDHTIEFGDLGQVSSYSYAGQECLIGTSGIHLWSYAGTPDSMFFMVVGQDANAEGSYGTDSDGNERPEDSVNGACPIVQDLSAPCS
jgi:predicted CXXCH cytochrome family protein